MLEEIALEIPPAVLLGCAHEDGTLPELDELVVIAEHARLEDDVGPQLRPELAVLDRHAQHLARQLLEGVRLAEVGQLLVPVVRSRSEFWALFARCRPQILIWV